MSNTTAAASSDSKLDLRGIELTEREHTAFYIASNAGSMITDLFHRQLKKDPEDTDKFLMELEQSIEAMAHHSIQQLFPNDAIYKEETGGVKGDSGYLWVLDAIDGSKNYARGLPLCGFQLALLCNGAAQFSIIYRPFTQETFMARRGGGARYHNGMTGEESQIHVSGRPMSQALAIFDDSVGRVDNRSSMLLKALSDKVAFARVFGAAVFDLPAIASGVAEILVTGIAKPEDVAPGSLLIEEAGGVVFDVDGSTPALTDQFMIFTTPTIREQMLSIVQAGGK